MAAVTKITWCTGRTRTLVVQLSCPFEGNLVFWFCRFRNVKSDQFFKQSSALWRLQVYTTRLPHCFTFFFFWSCWVSINVGKLTKRRCFRPSALCFNGDPTLHDKIVDELKRQGIIRWASELMFDSLLFFQCTFSSSFSFGFLTTCFYSALEFCSSY